MSNHSKDSILKFLQQHAPDAPLGKCMTIANDFQCFKESEHRLKMKLALLAEVLEFDDNGGFKDLAKKYKDDKAVLWALDGVCHCDAWVNCGPGKGTEGLKERVIEDIRQGKIQLGVSESLLRQIREDENEKNR